MSCLFLMMRIFMLPFLILGIVNSLQFGDRVSSQMQTLHQQWKTPWIELPAHEMPQFKKPDSNIVKINIPHEVGIISPNSDLKISLTYADSDLVIPWINAYDAQTKKCLNKLTVTFVHDEFDILTVNYATEYGSPLHGFDPSHPALTALEVVYSWDSVQQDDLAMGVTVLFILSLIWTTVLMCSVASSPVVQQTASHKN